MIKISQNKIEAVFGNFGNFWGQTNDTAQIKLRRGISLTFYYFIAIFQFFAILALIFRQNNSYKYNNHRNERGGGGGGEGGGGI